MNNCKCAFGPPNGLMIPKPNSVTLQMQPPLKALEAIKAAVLINGGSSVAMLAFIGTLVSRDYLSPAQITAITKPLIWFASGVGAAMIAAAAAYFTNLFIAGASNRRAREYEVSFIRVTPETGRSVRIGEVSRSES